MKPLTIAALTIFLITAGLFSLQTVLGTKDHADKRGEYLTIIEDQRKRLVKRMCDAKWPGRGEHYDECLEKT